MARPIWTGTSAFGLLNMPVARLGVAKHTNLHFHLLDARDQAPSRYQRINSATGAEQREGRR